MTNCKRCDQPTKLERWNDWFMRCPSCALLHSTGKPIDMTRLSFEMLPGKLREKKSKKVGGIDGGDNDDG